MRQRGLLHWRQCGNVRGMAHRVLTVCGLKGGIGKSAVATNLAAWWSAAGQRVLLIDADPNGSATKLHARGEGALLAAGSAVAPIQQAPLCRRIELRSGAMPAGSQLHRAGDGPGPRS
jgi:Mrp family chromosome partitioning ATPase